jgi:hypothetical protein
MMKNLLKTILIGVSLYCLFTLPHFIYMYSNGTNGIKYSLELIIVVGTISSILSVPISKMDIFN